MYRLVALALFFSGLSQALAYSTVNATVSHVRIDADGKGMVFFTQALASPAGCIHSAYTSALAFDSNSAGGKSILAAVLAAKATGSAISAAGKGTCSIYGNGIAAEDWSLGHVL